MANTVNEYVDSFSGEPKEWLSTFVNFMRENFPALPEGISYQMPTYKFGGKYIAFSAAKDHFSYHTLDFEMVEELKQLLPRAKFGRGCAKVSYADKDCIPILFEMSRKIVARNTSARS